MGAEDAVRNGAGVHAWFAVRGLCIDHEYFPPTRPANAINGLRELAVHFGMAKRGSR
jgi:hypothetical protein